MAAAAALSEEEAPLQLSLVGNVITGYFRQCKVVSDFKVETTKDGENIRSVTFVHTLIFHRRPLHAHGSTPSSTTLCTHTRVSRSKRHAQALLEWLRYRDRGHGQGQGQSKGMDAGREGGKSPETDNK